MPIDWLAFVGKFQATNGLSRPGYREGYLGAEISSFGQSQRGVKGLQGEEQAACF